MSDAQPRRMAGAGTEQNQTPPSGGDNYFTLINLPPAFDIDLQQLETAYFAQQRLYHPDRFVGKSSEERQRALQTSIDINQACQTLKNPLKRAQYLLHLQGIAVGTEADNVKPSQALLMETMQWREMIEDAKNTDMMKQLDGSLNAMHMTIMDNIAQTYRQSLWQEMAQETLRLGYVLKALDALRLKRLAVV